MRDRVRSGLFLFILLGLFAAAPISGQQRTRTSDLTAEEIAERALPAVVLIVCSDGQKTSQGSGFFVRPGVVVTNYHVVKGMSRGQARMVVPGKRARGAWRIEEVLEIDEATDLALLSIPDARHVTPLPLRTTLAGLKIGATVYALGNPEGLSGTLSAGLLSGGLRYIENRAVLQISAAISSGSSGGPIVNAKGEVIGVASAFRAAGQNLNFAVPAPLVTALVIKSEIRGDDYRRFKFPLEGGWSVPASMSTESSDTPEVKSVVGTMRPGETSEVASLRGLKGIYVVIQDLNEASNEITSEDQLRTSIELQLRQYKIRVVTEQQWMDESDVSLLCLNLGTRKPDRYGYSYTYTLSLQQDAALCRDRSYSMLVTTWQKTAEGYAGRNTPPSAVRESVADLVSKFINDFLAAQ